MTQARSLATPLRVLLRARSLASLALGLALRELFQSKDAVLRQAVLIAEAELRIGGLLTSLSFNHGRLLAIPPRRRPRAHSELAGDILRFQDSAGLTAADTARRFAYTPDTLRRWRRIRQQKGQLTLGPAQPPIPPSTRIGDPTRALIRECDQGGFDGKGHVSRALSVVARRVSISAVGYIRREGNGHLRPQHPRPPIVFATSGDRVHLRRGARPARRLPPRRRPACPTVEFTRRRSLHAPRRARAMAALRDAFQLALLTILEPLRAHGRERTSTRLATLHQMEAPIREERRLVRARLAKVPASRRPHFTPDQRVEILLHKHTLRIADHEVARSLLLARQTLSRWNVAADAQGSRLLQPHPPIASHEQAISRAAWLLPSAPQKSLVRIENALAEMCNLLPRQTREAARAEPETELSAKPAARRRASPIRARYPNHYWAVDITELRSLFGVYSPHLALVLDLHSRYPLAWGLWPKRPTSQETAAVLQDALARHGPPRHVLVRHLVSDQGGQFTGEPFESVLRERGIDHRFGAVGEHGSIAVIERLWKTLKHALALHELPPLQFPEFERRIGAAIDWYARLRPHSSLKAATPHERYFGLRPACLDAVPASRGLRGHPAAAPHDIEIRYHLPYERRLPYLVKTA